MQVETAMGFWCESLAFAQVGVFRNNSSQGHNLKYYASSFCNTAADLVLEAFSVNLRAPGAPKHTLNFSKTSSPAALQNELA